MPGAGRDPSGIGAYAQRGQGEGRPWMSAMPVTGYGRGLRRGSRLRASVRLIAVSSSSSVRGRIVPRLGRPVEFRARWDALDRGKTSQGRAAALGEDSLMSDREPVLAGVELGGTKCICVLASGPEDIREEVRIPTTTPGETLAAIRSVLDRWSIEGFAAIGIGSFGPLELDEQGPRHGCIVNTPKAGWSGTDVLAPFKGYGVPIGFDTDVNGAALAEGRWGGSRGLESYAYITVGTGIGVGVVVRGRTVRGLGHAEAGHLRIPRLAGETWAGVCRFHRDCVEGLASGPAIEARAGASGDQLKPSDPVWTEVVHALGALLHNLVLTASPQRILMGGGVVAGQPFLLPRLRTALLTSLAGYGMASEIEAMIDQFVAAPALGDQAGPLGAIALARDALAARAPGPVIHTT